MPTPYARDPLPTRAPRGRLTWSGRLLAVERIMARLADRRRLHRRYERKAEHFLAFTSISRPLVRYRGPAE